MAQYGSGNEIVNPITPDGNTGFDSYGQLWSWTEPNAEGTRSGTIIRDVRGLTCRLCNRGWENTSVSLRDQVHADRWVVHQGCLAGYQALRSFYELQEAFIKAGYLFGIEEIPSQYPHSPPWVEVHVCQNNPERTKVEGVKLVVGRRKRVWEIQAFGFGNLDALFDDVADTKGYSQESPHYFVHAWSLDDLVAYLTRIRLTIPLDTGRAGWVHETKPVVTATN